MDGEPAKAAALQTLALGPPQCRNTAPIAPGTGSSLHFDHQQPLGLGQHQIEFTPAAAPVAIKQEPAVLLQQPQGVLLGPAASHGGMR